MTIPVMSAAKRLGETSGWNLTNLHMQKLCYLAHMHYYGQQGEPLVKGLFEAWDYGPVHPELYRHLKAFGADAVQASAFRDCQSIPATALEGKYLDYAARNLPKHKLIPIAHWDRGAWARNYDPPRRHVQIPDADIIAEFEARMNLAEEQKANQNAKAE